MNKRRCTVQSLEGRMLLAGHSLANDHRADVNQDGIVDHYDVRLIVNELRSTSSGFSPSTPSTLDINADGRVTAADALQVINRIGEVDQVAGSVQGVVAAAGVPEISILDAQVLEGNSGTTTIEFTVTLSSPSMEQVSVAVTATDGSAAALQVERVSAGLVNPIYVTTAPGDPTKLFVVQQAGQIRVLDLNTNTLQPSPFLTVTDLLSGGERGLLGLAFHPDYAVNRRFYIYMTDVSGGSLVREYQASADGTATDPLSARRMLGFSQPFSNHNGGWMAFGPDGYLYIASGDGGSGNDPQGNAQDITNNWLGKMLRIDVNGDDFPADASRNYAIPAANPFVGVLGDDEIWAYGLRNPWRSSFDRETGDLYIADVGQNVWEEINFQPANSPGGENYGWKLREGLIATPSVGGPKPAGAIDPIRVYQHGLGADQGYSVTGGYVYRGPIEELQGNYFFADYVRSRVWSLRFNGDLPADFDGTNYTDYMQWTNLLQPDVGTIQSISSFGEDAEGNLYILDYSGGEIFRLSGGGDYLPLTANLVFEPGVEVQTFQVNVLGDHLPEEAETLFATLSTPVGGMIVRSEATGTILNDDPPHVQSIVVNRGEAQRSIVDEVVVTFDSNVALDESSGNAFVFRNLDTLEVADYLSTVSNASGSTVVTFQFVPGETVLARGTATPTLDDGSYELQIIGSRVQIGGIPLDGDSDGEAGGDMTFVDQFFRKFGDVNANGVVELLDFAKFRAAFGISFGEPTFNDAFDVDGDGEVGLLDFAEFRRKFGT